MWHHCGHIVWLKLQSTGRGRAVGVGVAGAEWKSQGLSRCRPKKKWKRGGSEAGTLLARLLFPLPTYMAITVSLLSYACPFSALAWPPLWASCTCRCSLSCHLICTERISGQQTFPIYVDIALHSAFCFLLFYPCSPLLLAASGPTLSRSGTGS